MTTGKRSLLLHGGEVVPQVLKAVCAAEERREMGGVDEQYVAGALPVGWHRDQRVEFGVAFGGEWVWSVRVDALFPQHPQRVAFRGGQLVMRQVWVEIERCHVVEQPGVVEIADGV